MDTDISSVPPNEAEVDSAPRFTAMSPEELAALRHRLSLKLPLPRLMALSALYQKENREPTERELTLLDTLLYPAVMRPHATYLAALQTREADTAMALSKLIEHSRGADGITPKPTPESALSVLCQTQRAKGILPPPPDYATATALSVTVRAHAPLLPRLGRIVTDTLALGDSPFDLTATYPCPSKSDSSLRPGDFYSLIPRPADSDSQTALTILLAAKDIEKALCRLEYVTSGEYIKLLLSTPAGMEADLSLLAGEDYRVPLPEGYVVCADEATTQTLLRRVHATGLDMTTFARVTGGDRLVLTERRTPVLSLPVSRLRTLTRPRDVDVRMDSQAAGTRPLPPSRLTEWNGHIVQYRTIPLTPTLSASDVQAALEEDITTMQASDADLSTLRLAVGITQNASTSQCALWSGVLALWQVLDEQSIPLLPVVYASSAECPGAITSVFIAKSRLSKTGDIPKSCQSSPF